MTKKYYAVRKGFKPGIYENWEECHTHVDGFSKAEFKGFKTLADAKNYMQRADEEESALEGERYELPAMEPYTKQKNYNEIGADETGKEFYGPMVSCAVYYDDEFNQDLFEELEINDSKKIKGSKLEKTASALMDSKNKLKFTIVEAIGDYSNPKQKYEHDTRWDFNELFEHTNNVNAVQAFMINQAIQQTIDKFEEPRYITYDRFVNDTTYYNYLKGIGNDMKGKSITDFNPNSRIIENIKATDQADAIKNSPSAAAAIIAKYVRNEFFEFIDQEYPVIDQNGEPIRMPQGDDPEENVKYGLLFIKEYGREIFDKFTKHSRKPYGEIIKLAKEADIIT